MLFVYTEQTEFHGTFFCRVNARQAFGSDLKVMAFDEVWSQYPLAQASIGAARMDASRNRRNANPYEAKGEPLLCAISAIYTICYAIIIQWSAYQYYMFMQMPLIFVGVL
ncbi:MAG: hypothetical protein PUE10_08430 [Bacteroidales bacterium]|nr:hypothetical protein [Bacteroidales bacterium]